MSFFDAPEREPFEVEWDEGPPPNPWDGPPDNVLGGVVPLELLLGRSERAAVLARRLTAYPSGLAFELSALVRDGGDVDEVERLEERYGIMFPFEPAFGPDRRLLPDVLRFGIELADGRKATNLDGPAGWDRDEEDGAPEPPVLAEGGGGSSDGHHAVDLWLWPLPPPGPLALVCDWPAYGIAETRTELDAQVVLDAAARAELVWGEDEERGADHGSSRTLFFGPAVQPEPEERE